MGKKSNVDRGPPGFFFGLSAQALLGGGV
jgi:hypothetical protein